MIVPFFIDKEYWGNVVSNIMKSDWESEIKDAESRRIAKMQKRLEDDDKKRRVEKTETEYINTHPHCTELFNHFDFGDEWYKVDYRW